MHGTIQAIGELETFLGRAKALGFHDKICAAFERADKFKIAFVGETIIDEYRYVLPLARPSKEFIVASVEAREPEEFLGGVIAATLHGEWPLARCLTASAAVRKTRFVDADFTKKLFEVYSSTDVNLTTAGRDRFQVELVEQVRDADVVVVFDFGHGLIGGQARAIAETAKFLAVNAQTNAGNYGFNPVTKYERADYICVDEPEARLAAGQASISLSYVAHHLLRKVNAGSISITRGRHGSSVYWDDANGANEATIPPFATNGLDTMGAGDAFLAVTAPLVAAGLELETAAFVGNVAGAIKVSIVGHRRHVTRAEIMAKIAELLA